MANNSSEERISQKLSSNSTGQKGPSNTKSILIIVGIVAAIVVTLVLVLSGATKKDEGKAVVTPDNVDEVLADLQNNKVEDGMYEVTMNTYWEFNDGDSASTNAYVENSTANTNDVYFDIVRSDTGEKIYSSPIIPIGSHLEDITLDEKLEAGEHACVLTYHLLDENEESVSTLNINLTIKVYN